MLPCAGLAPTASGQRLPGKAVTLVVGYAAGGGIDIIARLLAVRLAESLAQAVIVENRPGAAARIANEYVAKAAPDGLTLLVTTAVGAIDVAGPAARLDPVHDFAPVSTIASSPMVLVVNPSIPVMTVRDLVDRARAMPGTLNYSSSGSGTTGHLYAELFKLRTATDIVHVPFKGTAPALSALLGGVVEMAFVPVPGVVQYVKAGRLRALATTGAARSTLLPEVPTMREEGAGGVEASVWYGVLAPAGTPRDIVHAIALAIKDATGSAEFRRRLLELGAEPAAMTPDQFDQLLRDQVSQWTEVVKAAGIRGD
jgi:tripartite-type tricarboxylate transporter receptor subunit TctC